MAELMNSYRGVSCARCRSAIPVSPQVLAPRETEPGQTNVRYTFVARCKLCEYENVYAASDIQVFAGVPRQRVLRTRAAGA